MPENDKRGNPDHPDEETQSQRSHYPRFRPLDDIESQHPGYRPRSADHGDLRIRARQDKQHNRTDTCEQIEDDVPDWSEQFFDIVAEYPEVEHVANQMHPAAMQEHACEHGADRGKVCGGCQFNALGQFDGYESELHYNVLALVRLNELVEERHDVDDD